MYLDVYALLVKGGWVLIPIFLLSLFGWYIVVERWFYLKSKNFKIFPAQNNLRGLADHLHKSLVQVYEKQGNHEEALRLTVREILQPEFQNLNRHMSTLSVITSVAPLLGLLGTLTGMVRTFQIITLYGTGNPAMLAQGISEALLTTQAGLMVAFPLILCFNSLQNRINSLELNSLSFASQWISTKTKTRN